ncbi:Hypothetical predicted protein [Mytilus galloprovincialis]|uniref:Uncharacterized protein n=1 Tax=Mytilus galloprovincialis TaxID=29158 RepID=A0A8B6GB09_MYTGA|nr:Hypothetical predicted protein [Mytilus galloprovincialis]
MGTKIKSADVQPKKSKVLPAWETYFYNTVHISVVAYILYCVYRASNKYDGLLNVYDFEPGWSFIDREKRLLNPEDYDGKSYYILMFTLALTHLRYTSFCLEHVEHVTGTSSLQQDTDTDKLYMEIETEIKDKQTDEMKFSLMDAFVYIFYFPLFFCGPIITYDEFSKQMNESTQKPLQEKQMISVAFFALRMIFWAFFNEFILHFFYFNALQHNLSVIEDMDLWTLSGIGYCQGQFFMIKYTVMFGIPSVVARTCGIEPPAGPKCIGHIYTYSDMWKYFDRGMYSFIKRYIYLPLGGSGANIIQKLLCSLGCFIFVYIWHGIEYYIFLWTLFNFIGISLETLGYWIDKQTAVCKFKDSMPGIYRRMQGLVVVPLFVMSVFTAFCFFGGSVIGYMYFQKFIVKGWLKSWSIVIVVVYCCMQSSMDIHDRQKMKKKRE